MENVSKTWIQTFSGRKFFPLEPVLESIVIQDIAHALSLQCRFNGHTKYHYSIAQHSVMVSYLCDTADMMHGLLHDASEAYISDITSPLKRSVELATYRLIESKLQNQIYKRFDLSELEPISVKKADKLMLGVEVNTLFNNIHPDFIYPVKPPPIQIIKMTPEEAENLFLDRFYEIWEKRA